MSVGNLQQASGHEVASYRTPIAEFPVAGAVSPLPDIPTTKLPTLNYPARNCVTSRREQNDKIHEPQKNSLKKDESLWNRVYRFSLGWFGRTNGYAPSTSRYIVELSKSQATPVTLVLAADRFMTPAIPSDQHLMNVEIGDEKRLYYPLWLSEVNFYQIRQPYAARPGELIRESRCDWSDGPRDNPSNLENIGT
ncbi:MAG: hypothetical protein RL189_408 [Pseudomonadota bacterium]|jgi:hypothetical protein